jgi:hypothetical protein
VVWVGAPQAAPSDAAVVIAFDGWPEWRADELALATLDGEPVPCPGGRLTPSHDPRVLPPEWLRSAFALLSREEEYQDPRRDQWECFPGTQSRLHALGVLDRPLVNRWAEQLEVRLAVAARERGGSLEPLPRWPDGKRFAAALTHDVDDVTLRSWRAAFRLLARARTPRSYALRAGVHALWRAALRPPGDDPYWNFDRWASVEARHGFRSAFYWVPPAGRTHEYDPLYRPEDTIGFEGRRRRLADVLRELAGQGHEIGVHGSYLSHRSAGELGRQRATLERAAGQPVTGIRQHFLRFDVRATWRAQSEAGFAYDTTLGYNELPGFRAGIAAPFRPWDAERRQPHDLLELPLTMMDGALFRALRLDEAEASRRVAGHLEQVDWSGGLAVLLWHPNAAAERQFPGWWGPYETALESLSTREAWVARPDQIAQWWLERARRQSE